jgi:aldehyde dehydrogenase (NAD(P)+)
MTDSTLVEFSANGKSYKLNVGLFINNQFVPSVSGKKFDTVNPADGTVITSVFEGIVATLMTKDTNL